MLSRKSILTGVATLIVAAGAGYGLQNGGAIAERVLTDTPYLPAFPTEAGTPIPLRMPDATRTVRVAAATFSIDTDLQNDAPVPQFLPMSCETELTALPLAGAMVRLQLDAPCYQNQRITISHAGLQFADVTSTGGRFGVDFPALNPFAPYAVTFADGKKVEARTLGLSLAGVQRVAISWSGQPVLHVHGFELGAGFGDAGHIWAGAENNSPDGSTLIQLGNPDVISPILAEVYSVHTDQAMQDGTVEFLVEVELSGDTCGRQIIAQSFQLTGDGVLASLGLSFSLPDCGGESGYLVLNNLFQNMKIARN